MPDSISKERAQSLVERAARPSRVMAINPRLKLARVNLVYVTALEVIREGF
jgi:hypothetical protein